MPSATVSASVPYDLQNVSLNTGPSPATQNALDFVRALKAPTDPPHLTGPTKIQIAQAAWDSDLFYMPNKAEIIVEWVLTRLLKDKAENSAANPIFDILYWSLLEDVLCIRPDVHMRDKAWLAPLLSRIPITPIVVILYSRQDSERAPTVIPKACRCLSALWPLAVSKFSSETLLECFGTLLDYFSSHEVTKISARENFLTLGSLIVSSYRSSLANSSNKKKLFASFVQGYLRSWLQWTTEGLSVSIAQESYEAGVETLFNVEALRSFQEQHAASTFEKALASIASTQPDIVLQSLSRLFRSHGQAQTKHRVALYGQNSKQATGSTTEHARSANMAFFTLCESLLSHLSDSEEVWKARVSLLRLVDQEGLLSRTDENSANALRRIAQACITTLASAKKGNQEAANAIVTALGIIVHIDYDLVPFALSRILPMLAQSSFHAIASESYLQQLLEYHTKTRTIDVYVMASLKAFMDLTPTENDRKLYATYSSGPLLHRRYLDSLSRSVQSYLTPGQVLETAQGVIRHIDTLLEECLEFQPEGHSERPKKKRKITDNDSDGPTLAAVKLMLVARSAVVILTSLPLHSLLPTVNQEVSDAIRDALDRWIGRLKSCFKAIEKNETETWDKQLIMTAILRLHYSLATSIELQPPPESPKKLSSKLLSCLKVNHITLELRVEILHYLFFEISRERCEAAPVFDATLACIGNHESLGGVGWTGDLHELNTSDRSLPSGVAVFHLLCARWLPVFHELASDAQVKHLAMYMLKLKGMHPVASDPTSLASDDVFQRVLHDAQFWELSRLRDALSMQIVNETLPLDNLDQDGLWTHNKTERRFIRLPLEISHLRRMFEILLYTPQECMSREICVCLLRRALFVDAALTNGDFSLSHDHLTLLMYLRQFIHRTLSQASVEHSALIPYILCLVDSLGQLVDLNPQIFFLTRELLKTHMSAVIIAASKQRNTDFLSLLQHFLGDIHLSLEMHIMEGHHLESVIVLISLLTSEHEVTHFADDVQQHIRQLQDQLFAFVLPRISSSNETFRPELLDLWRCLLSLRRWLDLDTSQPPLVALNLSKGLSARLKEASIAEHAAILAIALEELHLNPPNRRIHLDFIVAVYLLSSRHTDVKPRLDEVLSQASKTLSVDDYDDMLDTIVTGLQDEALPTDELSSIIHLLGLMLHGSPESTLKVVQKHTARCLGVFANRKVLIDDTSLTFDTLNFMAKHFNDRPAAIRSLEVCTAFSFVGRCLAGSSVHIRKSSTSIYQEIISVLSALIRLRRDLVLPVLPLLGHSLHKLTLVLRTLTPNLGATQSELVSRTLPRWVNANDPMTAEESKALARLLTTLTTKSTIRVHTNANTEARKADSLARPFSKHAAHVLTAYLSALNDPLCVMSSAIRKELEPGLFALCEVMGERNRDALMVTLHVGEMTVMKGIWRLYEKQRYIGKG